MATLIRGTLVHTPSLGEVKILQDYLLGIDDKGFINFLENASSDAAQTLLSESGAPPTIIPPGSFILPTFCDLHLHAPQFLYQGTGLHLPLMEWLNEYAFKAEEKIDADPLLARKVYTRLADRLSENGTGAVLLFGTIKEETNIILAECMRQTGIRAFVGKLSMDQCSRPTYVEASASAAIDSVKSFILRCNTLEGHLPLHQRLIEPVLTPRFVPTCSDELLSQLGRLSTENNLRIQSHMAEAHDQVEWVRQQRNMEDIDVFDKHGLLTPRTIQAHCTFLDQPMFNRVVTRGTAIAHCPLSNAYFSAEPFPLREALDTGVRVGLGTDIAGGYDVSIMSTMRHAVTVSRMREGGRIMADSRERSKDGREVTNKPLSVDWKEALYLATRGGAEALGLQSGVFRPGAPFDAQQINIIENTTKLAVGPLDFLDGENIRILQELSPEAIEKWFCLGDVRNRIKMWIQGKVVLLKP
ncbi:Metallo-dependent hydrolase [Irpex rosettiformis]|uniref:Metallo-dependent hydrolase n=1 Tax=Irpex rosettiformis TaxID=378272 RepID=A0ACB8U0G2_9APHY|nr:Metallo-dependent hydrolase [Irpex rosettiformis]